MPEQTYYEILDLAPTATLAEITQSYRLHAAAWHPDRHKTANKQPAEEKMKQINEAYRVLSNTQKRKLYDAALFKKQQAAVEAMEREEDSVLVEVPGTGVQLESDIYDKIALLMARGQSATAARELNHDVPGLSNAKVWEILDCIKARRYRR